MIGRPGRPNEFELFETSSDPAGRTIADGEASGFQTRDWVFESPLGATRRNSKW
jgi:hypothetical protein